MEITVYGTAITCPSCVGAPSSEETFSWLQAVLGRKYEQEMTLRYVDFETATSDQWTEALKEDVYFYPLIVLDDEMIDEGYVKLKTITAAIDAKLSQTG